MTETDEKWMWQAIRVAREAEKLGEVPVGAVLVDSEGKILAATSNRTIKNNDPTPTPRYLLSARRRFAPEITG